MSYLKRLQLTEEPPPEEICRCSTRTPILLRYAFTEFPVYCADCLGQILPSTMDLSESLASSILDWRTIYAALYDLWLSSSEYEEFARAALLDPDGEVNREGLALAERLGKQRDTYYWWFRNDDTKFAVEHCPVCRGETVEHQTRNFRFCRACRIAI